MAKNRDDPLMDSVLRKALGGRAQQPGSPCPDENRFAAYLENRLESSQRAAFEHHTSNCRNCREILALSLRMEGSGQAEGPLPAEIRKAKSLRYRFSLPLSSLALLVVAGLALWVIYQSYPGRTSRPAGDMAEMKAPASPSRPVVDSLHEPPASDAPREQERRLSGLDGSASGPAESPRISSAALEDRRARETTAGTESVSGDKDALLNAKEKTEALRAEVQKPSSPEPGKTESAGIGETGRVSPAQSKKDANEAPEYAEVAKNWDAAASPAVRPDSFRRNADARDVLRGFSQAADSYRGAGAGGRVESLDEGKSAARQPASSARVGEKTRAIGPKTFIAFSGYWIDSECARYPDEAPVELTETEEKFSRIRKVLPTIEQIRSSGQPILLRWEGITYLIR